MGVDDGVALALGRALGAVSRVVASDDGVDVGVGVVVTVVRCHGRPTVSPPYAPAAVCTHSIYLHMLISDLSITRIKVLVSCMGSGSFG